MTRNIGRRTTLGLAGRLASRERIYGELAKFTALHPPRELMNLLQANGVPAGMVQRSSDHMEDPQLKHRRFFRQIAIAW